MSRSLQAASEKARHELQEQAERYWRRIVEAEAHRAALVEALGPRGRHDCARCSGSGIALAWSEGVGRGKVTGQMECPCREELAILPADALAQAQEKREAMGALAKAHEALQEIYEQTHGIELKWIHEIAANALSRARECASSARQAAPKQFNPKNSETNGVPA